MKMFSKFLMGMALALGLVVMAEGPAAAACTWNPLNPNQWTCYPDPLPGSTSCGSSPGANHAFIYTQIGWNNSDGHCQDIYVGTQNYNIANLGTYYLDGTDFWVKSVWLGASVNAGYYSGYNFTGSNTSSGYGGYIYDFGSYGWFPGSFVLHRH